MTFSETPNYPPTLDKANNMEQYFDNGHHGKSHAEPQKTAGIPNKLIRGHGALTQDLSVIRVFEENLKLSMRKLSHVNGIPLIMLNFELHIFELTL